MSVLQRLCSGFARPSFPRIAFVPSHFTPWDFGRAGFEDFCFAGIRPSKVRRAGLLILCLGILLGSGGIDCAFAQSAQSAQASQSTSNTQNPKNAQLPSDNQPITKAARPEDTSVGSVPPDQDPTDSTDSTVGRVTVLELFSSEICMFCPEAEAFLSQESAKDSVIALTCMTDYMQSRPDGPGHAVCSARQADYALKLGTGPVYTPQIIVNGAADAVGHRPPSIEAALQKVADKKAFPVRLVLEPKDKGRFSVRLPNLVASSSSVGPFPVTALLYRAQQKIPARSGSGPARTVPHAVFDVKALTPWDGRAGIMTLKTALRPAEGIAVLVQDPLSGAIVAVGTAGLPGAETAGRQSPSPAP